MNININIKTIFNFNTLLTLNSFFQPNRKFSITGVYNKEIPTIFKGGVPTPVLEENTSTPTSGFEENTSAPTFGFEGGGAPTATPTPGFEEGAPPTGLERKLEDFKIFNNFFDFSRGQKIENLTIPEINSEVNEILRILDTTTGSFGKGYLNNTDLTTYPLIKEVLPAFINMGKADGEAFEFIKGNKVMLTYKWIYNLVLLNLYMVCWKTLHTLEPKLEEVGEVDSILDFIATERALHKRLDPAIKQLLLKRGITLIQNIYTGFDTEYKSTEIGVNQLLSCQMAITTKTYVKIPKKLTFSISKIDVAKDIIRKHHHNSELFYFNKIEIVVQNYISTIRSWKYGTHDDSMLIFSECLKKIKGFTTYESDDFVTFGLPRSVIHSYICYVKSYSFKNMVDYSNKIGDGYLENTHSMVIELLQTISKRKFIVALGLQNLSQQISSFFGNYTKFEELNVQNKELLPVVSEEKPKFAENELDLKKLSRLNREDLLPSNMQGEPQMVSVTRIKNNYFIAHLTQADLSIMSDFEDLKDNLNIVNGSFVTLGKPFTFENSNIHIRDTMLLAPGGKKSLASIGNLYGETFKKLEISKNDLENMDIFLKNDKPKFEAYALRDALITLVHASWMEDFNFSLGGIGVPLSLSSIGRKFVRNIWEQLSYPGYQISNKYLLGDTAATITPIGLNVIKSVANILPLYTSNYKGGRNESFMYGVDRENIWYDYDLTSAYTTVMSKAGHPVYDKCRKLKEEELINLSQNEILYSYLIIKASFIFNDNVKYPSIPCYVDETCTVYPKMGTCILTGSEYLLAKSQNCKLKIHDIYHIPFSNVIELNQLKDAKEKPTANVITPFGEVINQIQAKRREFPKGTISNLMYKEIGNSIYGSVVRGMSNKRRFDIKTNTTQRVEGDNLTNPLIASWTTAFIRSIIGECLHALGTLNALVVSVTTDGFITNLKDLETYLTDENFLFSEFKNIRLQLSGDSTGLELKHSGKGIVS